MSVHGKLLRQPDGVEERDLVPGGLDQPLLSELMERSGDDLSDRSHGIRELLLAHRRDELGSVLRRCQVEEVPDDTLSEREEGLFREVIQCPVELAGQLLGAGASDAGL